MKKVAEKRYWNGCLDCIKLQHDYGSDWYVLDGWNGECWLDCLKIDEDDNIIEDSPTYTIRPSDFYEDKNGNIIYTDYDVYAD